MDRMIAIDKTPDDYRDTILYKKLVEKDGQLHTGLREKVDHLISKTIPLLEKIGDGTFGYYTLHNPLHSRKLLHLAGYVIPEDTLEQLSCLEIAVMIMSFYFHDLGMVVCYRDKQKIIESAEFADFLISRPEFNNRISSLNKEITEVDDTLKSSLDECIAQVRDAAITEFVRPNHASRKRYDEYLPLILEERKDLFDHNGSSFLDYFLMICSSHNDNTQKLVERDANGDFIMRQDLFFGSQRLNLQYCAAILRIVDILDFDRERTPSILYKAIGIDSKKLPGFRVSLREWNKQMAVQSIVIKDNEINVQAFSNSPNYEKAIRSMCQTVEREIRDTTTFLHRNPDAVSQVYALNLPLIVTCDIRPHNYVYRDYAIHLDNDAIIELLMGENLYERARVAIRELLQNSLDACKVMTCVDKYTTPNITVSVQQDGEKRQWLIVKDNGIGMDDFVLTNYFFNIGKSYYRSAEFARFAKNQMKSDFTPISRFGIGMLSVFMIGDTLKVTTQNLHSAKGDTKLRTLIVDSSDTLAVVNEQSNKEPGTKIEVRLKHGKDTPAFLNELFGYVKETFIHPLANIKLAEPDGTVTEVKDNGFTKISDKALKTLDEKNIEVFTVDFAKYSERLKGVGHFFFFKNPDGSLSYRDSNNQLHWGKDILKPSQLFEGSNTNSRLTVNGIYMQMKRIGSLYNARKNQIGCLIDIDVIGGKEILYDVSRSKVVGKGIDIVRTEIFETVEKAFKDAGLFERFDVQTNNQYKKALVRNKPSKALDAEFYSEIEKVVPFDLENADSDFIREIAKKKGLDTTTVKRYVSAVIYRRKIEKRSNSK